MLKNGIFDVENIENRHKKYVFWQNLGFLHPYTAVSAGWDSYVFLLVQYSFFADYTERARKQTYFRQKLTSIFTDNRK